MTTRSRAPTWQQAEPRHGGALVAASARYGVPVGGWLDLSTGINPDPWTVPPLPGEAFSRLPDPRDLSALIDIAREVYGLDRRSAVVPAPGSDLALRLLPCLVSPASVAILSPTYSGHAEAWQRAGHRVSAVRDLTEAAGKDVLVLANPNNPDGRILDQAALLGALAALPAGGLLLVDEAFADVAPESSIVPALGDPRLMVLRSFGKFYGLAGLRLGFVLGNGPLIERLADLLGDWPLSGPALAVGRGALADTRWRDATRLRLAERRARLDIVLTKHGLTVSGGTDLFRLVATTEAGKLREALAHQGVWTRIFDDQPGLIRFGLPREIDLPRLDIALGAFCR